MLVRLFYILCLFGVMGSQSWSAPIDPPIDRPLDNRIEMMNPDDGYHPNNKGKPSRSERQIFQVGQNLPDEILNMGKPIDARAYPELSHATAYQQWLKFHRRFVLINVMTKTIIKVVPNKREKPDDFSHANP